MHLKSFHLKVIIIIVFLWSPLLSHCSYILCIFFNSSQDSNNDSENEEPKFTYDTSAHLPEEKSDDDLSSDELLQSPFELKSEYGRVYEKSREIDAQ